MAHTLLVGTTRAGKTVLAKRLVAKEGRETIVWDPLLSKWPDNCEVFQSLDDFEQVAKASVNKRLVLDESGSQGTKPSALLWAATMSRHWGHDCLFCMQRFSMNSPVIRDQCDYLCLFRCTPVVANTMAEEFTQPKFATAIELPKLEYLFGGRFTPVTRHKIVFQQDGRTTVPTIEKEGKD